MYESTEQGAGQALINPPTKGHKGYSPKKGVPQIAIRVPKLYHNLEKWVEIEVFSPHFVVHMWYTFRFRVPKLGILFQTKKC